MEFERLFYPVHCSGTTTLLRAEYSPDCIAFASSRLHVWIRAAYTSGSTNGARIPPLPLCFSAAIPNEISRVAVGRR